MNCGESTLKATQETRCTPGAQTKNSTTEDTEDTEDERFTAEDAVDAEIRRRGAAKRRCQGLLRRPAASTFPLCPLCPLCPLWWSVLWVLLFEGFPRSELQDVYSGRRQELAQPCGRARKLRECAVMHRDDGFHAEPDARERGMLGTHRVDVTNRQERN